MRLGKAQLLICPSHHPVTHGGKNDQAIKMMAKFYHLDDPGRAEIILGFLAYAHDQL
jgi:hypothetical protein